MSLRTLAADPYRILLAFGTLQLLAALGVWTLELIGRHHGLWLPMAPGVAPGNVHGLLMLYGVFPFFIFGFLMTTYPRWLDAPPLRPVQYLPAALLLGAGALLFYTGLYARTSLLAAGVLAWLGGYLWAWWGLWRIQARGRIRGRLYERYLNIALALGAVGIVLVLAVLQGQPRLWSLLRGVGLWGFLVPILVTMSHRMLPFLTSCVTGTDPVDQPRGGLHAMLVLVALHGVLELAGQPRWLWLVDLPLALIAAYHLHCWAFARCLRARLLAMFHVSFAWFVIAMLLYGASSLQGFLGRPDGLARAPLHALGIGFALGMTLAMGARIARVHTGLAPVATAPVWAAFWALNLAALLRILAEIFPQAGLNPLAGILLVMALLAWAAHGLPLFLKR